MSTSGPACRPCILPGSPKPPQPLTEKLGDDLGTAPQGDALLVPAELLGHEDGWRWPAQPPLPRRPVQMEPRPAGRPFPAQQRAPRVRASATTPPPARVGGLLGQLCVSVRMRVARGAAVSG